MVFTIISVVLISYPSNDHILNTTAKQRCAAAAALRHSVSGPSENMDYNTKLQTS